MSLGFGGAIYEEPAENLTGNPVPAGRCSFRDNALLFEYCEVEVPLLYVLRYTCRHLIAS